MHKSLEKATYYLPLSNNFFNPSTKSLSFTDLDKFGTGFNPLDCPQEILHTEDEIQYLLNSLDITKSAGHDHIPARVLRLVAPSITASVT